MENYKVAQEYPNSKNNTITAKTVLVKRTVKGSLQGDWIVVLNNQTVASIVVTDNASYKEVNDLYETLCTQYRLTSIDESTNSLKGY